MTDVEPQRLPSLYAGTPLRLYGRYSGAGPVEVRVIGKRDGKLFEQVATLTFPEKETKHPEIERMWAWRRVQRLLKDADRAGSREQAVNEVVRLGEDFSIATEYTSFLVLENDAEYQRWKIERRPCSWPATALEARRAAIEKLRQKAVTGLGPEAAAQAERSPAAAAQQPAGPNASARSIPKAPPQQGRRNDRSADLPWGSGSGGSGSGAVGPLFAAAAVWLARRRRGSARRQADANER